MRSEHLLYRFPRCQLLKNELYGNAGPSNDRFAHHDRWICLDQFFSHSFYLRISTAAPNTPAWITQTPASRPADTWPIAPLAARKHKSAAERHSPASSIVLHFPL